MKIRLTRPVPARSAWLIAGRSAAGALLLSVAVAACTSGGSGSATPSVFTPTPQTSGAGGATPTPTRAPSAVRSSASARASASASASRSKASAKATPTPKPKHTVPLTHTLYPTAAPQTGGGGTAGLQDGLLLGVGGAAVVAGLGSFAYRRRVTGKIDSGRPESSGSPDPDREPADR